MQRNVYPKGGKGGNKTLTAGYDKLHQHRVGSGNRRPINRRPLFSPFEITGKSLSLRKVGA